MAKYELVSTNTKTISNTTLYQIRALTNISRYGVVSGDLGGYVESESNLSQEGDCWISSSSNVYGNVRINGNSYVGGECIITDSEITDGRLRIKGKFEIKYSDFSIDDVP